MLNILNQVDTEVRFNDQVIFTKFTGRISKEQICFVIREWSYLLRQSPSIDYAVFDFSNAYFAGQSRRALLDIAIRTNLLNSTRKNLRIIGICPTPHEYFLAKHWADYATNLHSMSYGQVTLFRCKNRAMKTLQSIGSPTNNTFPSASFPTSSARKYTEIDL